MSAKQTLNGGQRLSRFGKVVPFCDLSSRCPLCSSNLQSVLNRYPSVFQKCLGTLKGFKARIYVDPDAQPRFHPARSVPYAFREKVDKELQRLQDEGTLEPIEFAEWAAPIVAVLKSDKSSIRICGDISVTINPVSKLDRYPIPKVEDLFTRLKKGKYFSKLDLSQAYQQVLLQECDNCEQLSYIFCQYIIIFRIEPVTISTFY